MENHLRQTMIPGRGLQIDDTTKSLIFKSLWPQLTRHGSPPEGCIAESDLKSYFDYYTAQFHAYLEQRGRFVAIRTHQDITDLVADFKLDRDRAELSACLSKRFCSTELDVSQRSDALADNVGRSIDLAARIFLMLKIGRVSHSTTNGTPLQWSHGTLRQFVRQHLEIPQVLNYTRVKLPKTFNAHNLERIGGIKLAWTDNLADHLRLIDDDEKVAIFAHPTFLMLHSQIDSVFPQDFLEETLRTIKLLFPANNKPLQKWFRKSFPSETLDSRIATCGSVRSELRHIERFSYWRDRLVVLKEAFDESEPKTLSQWWWDRRKRVQWCTLWIAVLVLMLGFIFGIVQSTANLLQTYNGLHSSSS